MASVLFLKWDGKVKRTILQSPNMKPRLQNLTGAMKRDATHDFMEIVSIERAI